MAWQMSRRTRLVLTFVFAAFCVLTVSLYKAGTPADKALIFAMTVHGPDGDVVASPVVVGQEGQRVQVRLVCESDPQAERMSLTLDPLGLENGEMLYSYQLSLPGQAPMEHGLVKLHPGKERRIRFRANDSRGMTLSLYAAPLKHPGVEKYLQSRKQPRRLTAS